MCYIHLHIFHSIHSFCMCTCISFQVIVYIFSRNCNKPERNRKMNADTLAKSTLLKIWKTWSCLHKAAVNTDLQGPSGSQCSSTILLAVLGIWLCNLSSAWYQQGWTAWSIPLTTKHITSQMFMQPSNKSCSTVINDGWFAYSVCLIILK